MLRGLSSFLSLFCSLGTLICCALPALLVALGLGAALAGLVTNYPHITWLSEQKNLVFLIAGGLILCSVVIHWRTASISCPVDGDTAAACGTAKTWSQYVLYAAILFYAIGAFFAFAAPLIFG